MARSLRSRTMAAAATATLLLAFSGCTGDDEPDADPTPSPSSSSASPTDSASPTEEPSESASTPAATGPLLKIPGVQMSAPAGWELSEGIVKFEAQAAPPTGPGAAQLVAIAFPGTPPSLDESAKLRQKTAGEGFKRLPDIEVAGETFYHLSGKSGRLVSDNLGTVSHGYDVTILFDLSADLPAAEREQIIADSLASFAWE